VQRQDRQRAALPGLTARAHPADPGVAPGDLQLVRPERLAHQRLGEEPDVLAGLAQPLKVDRYRHETPRSTVGR
jgi:hypothetical protein